MRPEVLQHPDPRLRQVSVEVTHFDKGLRELIARMILACTYPTSTAKGIGLAAVQIGEAKRVIVVLQGLQWVEMVNPVIEWTRGVQTVKDGCLSVQRGRYFRARTRPLELCVRFVDAQGIAHRRRAKGLHAAAIAHELDHLEGKLFTDAIEDAA